MEYSRSPMTLRREPGPLQAICRKAVLLLVLLSVFPVGFAGCKKAGGKANNSDDKSESAVPVTVAEVKAETYRELVRGIGTLQAEEIVEISPELSGIVKAIHFQEGQKVEQDSLLFELDDSKLQRQLDSTRAALKRAKSQLNYARKSYQRFQDLAAKGAATKEKFDKVSSEYESSRAEVSRLQGEVELIREKISDTRIRAPMNGKVGERHVDVGDFVMQGRQLVTLYSTGIIEIGFTVPERYMGRVAGGQNVRIMVDAYPERRFKGKVTYVSPSVDTQTRNFRVKAVVDNHEGLLKSGAFATALLTVEVKKNRPSVTESALVATTKGYVVYVVKNAGAEKRNVTVGLRKVGKAEIIKGLDIGELVVAEGHQRLTEGRKVKIINRGKPGNSK